VPVLVVPVETVREEDGLALSSRNKYLTAEQREIAPVLSRVLRGAHDAISAGERRVAVLQEDALALFAAQPEARVEYFEITDPDTLQPLDCVDESALIAGAIWLGTTRLIDNMRWARRTRVRGAGAGERRTAGSPGARRGGA
jgi:pantoate--beta-alanine ligase